MGCGESREPRPDKATPAAAEATVGKPKGRRGSDRTSQMDATDMHSSLEVPLPGGTGGSKASKKGGRHAAAESDVFAAASATGAATPSARDPRAGEPINTPNADARERSAGAATTSPSRAWLEQLANASFATTSSAPRLFRLEDSQPTPPSMLGWQWWFEAVRRDGVTKDGTSRRLLQDLPNRLACQHDEDPAQVELNLSTCYLERAAPYLLGRLFATIDLVELQWVTSLRLDGNYIADEGFGVMLATMSDVNERRSVLPHLEQLYLNNMNLDARTIAGLLFYLFPYDSKQLSLAAPHSSSRKRNRQTSRRTSSSGHSALAVLADRTARLPSHDFAPFQPPTKPLFPRLSLLSVSENQSLGVEGLVEMLRSFLLTHYETRVLAMLDISWCDIDDCGVVVAAEFAQKVFQARDQGRHPVVPSSIVLMGNPLGRNVTELLQDVTLATGEPHVRFVV